MASPSAVQILQMYRGQGEGKLQFLKSFQPDRCETNCLTLIECRAAKNWRPAPFSLSDVLALNQCQGFCNSKYP